MLDITSWQVLYIDDDEELLEQAKEALNTKVVDPDRPDTPIALQTESDFSKALGLIEAHRFDLVILDVKDATQDRQKGNDIGITILENIQQRRFMPIIFYTSNPNLVVGLANPLIRVVEKTERFRRLLEVISELFATRLPLVNRALVQHLEAIQREYMWDFVAKNWESFEGTNDKTSLAYLLARRLAVSLAGPGISQLARDLGDESGLMTVSGRVHPMQYYIMPPIEEHPLAGDIYTGQITEQTGYWILLTPSCDMQIRQGRDGQQIPAKAERVLLVACMPLENEREYRAWAEQPPEPPRRVLNALENLLKNNLTDAQSEMFFVLPGAISLPTLVFDFQQLYTVTWGTLQELRRVASMDSPFAEALVARFNRYFGRLGTPDLDVDLLMTKLRSDLPRR